MHNTNQKAEQENMTLVLGGTGKTGRRVAKRLADRNLPIRIGSRSGKLPFLWEDRTTWEPVLENVASVYIVYYPDLAVPAAAEAIQAFTDLAVKHNVRRLVLLSGRGEPEAQRCEGIVQNAGIPWTIVRTSWFCQNFSEGFLRELVNGGEVALPAAAIREPFIDVEDIADVAVAALTEEGHTGKLYELTGPHLMTFAEAVEEIANAIDRPVRYTQISPEAFASTLTAQGFPADAVMLMNYLFTTVLDGRNAYLADGVRQALGRSPRDFSEYVRQAAATDVWQREVVHHG